MRKWMNKHPSRLGRVTLGMIPLVLSLIVYQWASLSRLSVNPADKLLPSFSAMGNAWWESATLVDMRSGQQLLWADTWISLIRLGGSMAIATLLGLLVGVLVGIIPVIRAALSPFLAWFSLIPPLAVLPILFILFGLGEISKVVLIVVGIAPFLMRDIAIKVEELPQEQLIKAQTLGAGTWVVLWRVVLPQILPRLMDSVRLSLGSAWLYLIAAEAIAAEGGLGYRIFLLRRYLAMDTILPYVAWITLLAFGTDWFLKKLTRWAFPWYNPIRNT